MLMFLEMQLFNAPSTLTEVGGIKLSLIYPQGVQYGVLC